MRSQSRHLALLCTVILLVAVVALAAACGEGEAGGATVTTAATSTTAAPTTTSAPATTEPAASEPAAPTSGSVIISGSVDKPQTLAAADLQKMKLTTITAEHPKLGPTEYTGVLLSDLMQAVGVQASATKVVMAAADGFMAEVALAELDPNAMLAMGDDGKLNGVMPGLNGKAWVKDIVTMQFN